MRPTWTCTGFGGQRSMRACAAGLARATESPRPHSAWPRGSRPETTISRCKVSTLRMGQNKRGVWAGGGRSDAPFLYGPKVRTTSLPSWTCAGMYLEISAWPHSAPCRRARNPRPVPVAAYSLAWCQHLPQGCPLASQRGPVPDSLLPT